MGDKAPARGDLRAEETAGAGARATASGPGIRVDDGTEPPGGAGREDPGATGRRPQARRPPVPGPRSLAAGRLPRYTAPFPVPESPP